MLLTNSSYKIGCKFKSGCNIKDLLSYDTASKVEKFCEKIEIPKVDTLLFDILNRANEIIEHVYCQKNPENCPLYSLYQNQ